MSGATVYGYPRQGANRELKRAVEGYWAGRLDAEALVATARELRLGRVTTLAGAGLDEIPTGDFSLYDHVLDTAWMLGAIPERHLAAVPDASTPQGRLDRYFAMARGTAAVEPLEMTKWFATNYHYLVPEVGPDTDFRLDADQPLTEFSEARRAGVAGRPVILGPVSFLLLAKSTADGFAPIELLDRVLPCYLDLLAQLHAAGAEWVQIDEPCLVTDQPAELLDRTEHALQVLAGAADRPKILLATYFDHVGRALPVLARSAVEGIGLDMVGSGRHNLELVRAHGGLGSKRLVAGVVDGHNIWRTDLTGALQLLRELTGLAGTVDVAASCSLLHVPLDVDAENHLDPQITAWWAFARQKVDELVILRRGLAEGSDAIADELAANTATLAARRASPLVTVAAVRDRLAELTAADRHRSSGYGQRAAIQHAELDLPPLPTTTIGSFPQTTELRQARAALRRGELSPPDYEAAMKAEIDAVIGLQEDLGVDVLVHGEPERNDMVQYFAEQLAGYLATEHGWVQSYGTRYVRPPIIAGDVYRPEPMTVGWTTYAQSRTAKPVKGMLTGPVTMLAWSFVRDDQPLADTARQVALALRDEVTDLEAAGTRVIQVDEPALRETLPLRAADRPAYLDWATDAFRLATSGVADATQIHTHMCYAEFGDVLGAIIDLDADVISLEAARSGMEIVGELSAVGYPNEIGPGVWDIHSPRVPSAEEMAGRLAVTARAFAGRAWANPDCGLKTRGYDEVRASITNLVTAAARVRAQLA